MTRQQIQAAADQASEMPIPEWLAPDKENSESTYYRFLYLLAKAAKPVGSIVELGTWRGVSAMCLAEGAPHIPVYTLDNAHQIQDWTKRQNIVYVNADSMNVLEQARPIEILFIDTEHVGPRAEAEFNAWLPLLSKRAIVLFDDTALNASMSNFWAQFWPTGFDKMNLTVHGAVGFGVIFRPTDDDGGLK